MNLKNLIVSAGLFALMAAPVFANEPTTAPTEGAPAAGEAHPGGHPDAAHKTAKVKKAKKSKKATTPAPAEGTEAPAPAPGN